MATGQLSTAIEQTTCTMIVTAPGFVPGALNVVRMTIAPVLVYATIALGAFIGAEATLAFLGIGVRAPVVSWGLLIADSRDYFESYPHMLLFPGAFVTLTVLAFVMLGDGIRDALDPKSR